MHQKVEVAAPLEVRIESSCGPQKLDETEAAIPERMELARQGRWPVYRRR
jgi:hypothetical protein